MKRSRNVHVRHRAMQLLFLYTHVSLSEMSNSKCILVLGAVVMRMLIAFYVG